MKITTISNNFSRAQIDQDLNARFGLPIYSTGSQTFENFISNFKGNGIYRSGFENIIAFQDCAFVEFRFSQNQNYIIILYANKMRFMSYDVNGVFGFVLDSGGPAILEITTPWSLAESKEIADRNAYSQNFDVMVFDHEDHEPYELTRLAADDFQLRPQTRKDDPFPLTHAASKVITAITQATEAVVSVAAHSYVVDERVLISGVVGMTEINNYTAVVIDVPTAGTFTIALDTTDFTAYTSAGTSEKVLTGDYPSTCLFYKSRIYHAASTSKITTVWASEAGFFDVFTLPATVVDESALQFTIAEFTSKIEWLYPGQNSLIAGTSDLLSAINGGGVGVPITASSIDAISTSADGCNSVYPIAKDGFVFYSSLDGRTLQYFSYDLLTETFIAPNANILSYDITQNEITKLRHVKTREDLIFALRGDGRLLSCNFDQAENIIGWNAHNTEGTFEDIAQISDNEGIQQLFALSLRDGVYYIERQAPYVEFDKRRTKDFFSDDKSSDDAAFYRKLAEQLKDCIFLDNAETIDNLQSTTITYDSGAGTITDGTAPFTSGDVGKQIVYRTITGYESGRFEITAFTSTSIVEVDVLQTPTSNTFSSWYLTFDTLSGLSRFDGLTVSVVADGGFLDEFVVSGGSIAMERQVTHAVVGYGYRGVINSFPLGFQLQGNNTQTTMKAVSRVGFRMVNSAGVKFGTTAYRLEPIQEIKQGSLNYLPPLPINTTQYITYVDSYEIDKEFLIVQDLPLPVTITGVMIEADYTVGS